MEAEKMNQEIASINRVNSEYKFRKATDKFIKMERNK